MKKSSNHHSPSAMPLAEGLSRRHFLRGLGACLTLPALASLGPTRLLAAGSPASATAPAGGAPVRTAFVYFPNGSIPSAWWPERTGTDFELSPTLSSLAPHRSQIQIVGGLEHLNATAGGDGAGDHARANGTFLTGVRMRKSATDIRAGISIDQIIAQKIGHQTRLPSLELTCDARRNTGACDSGYSCAYQYNVSWSSATTPMTPEANPRLVFERLFGSGSPGERAISLQQRREQQRSILDFVMEDAHAMQRRLNARDRDKLDQYLTGVRELEGRIQRAEQFGPVTDPQIETPAGIPPTYGEHVQMMFDLMVLAFQTDSTRVATFLLAHDGSNRSFKEIGVSDGHHDLSHHFNDAEKIQKIREIDTWYVQQFAQFLGKLEATKDVDGRSLLHNSMILYGSGNADGNRHSHDNLPILLAGAGGGSLTPGRYVRHGRAPATNLFLSMADRMGVTGLERFGDSTGRLANI
jgi:hypothetical protein